MHMEAGTVSDDSDRCFAVEPMFKMNVVSQSFVCKIISSIIKCFFFLIATHVGYIRTCGH